MATFYGAFTVKEEGRPQTRTSFQRPRALTLPMEEHGNVTFNYLNRNGRPTGRELSSSPQRHFIEFNREGVLFDSEVKNERFSSSIGSRPEGDSCRTPHLNKSVGGQVRIQSQDLKKNRKTFRSPNSGWQSYEEGFQHDTNVAKVQCDSNSLFDYSSKYPVD